MTYQKPRVSHRCGRLLAALLLPILPVGSAAAQAESGASDGSRVSVSPDWGLAGDYGTWTVRYVAGPAGLPEGASVRVQLPDTWHAGDRNSATPLQGTDPTRDHYVSARASRPRVEVRTTVEGQTDQLLDKGRRAGLDGRAERYVFVVRVDLTEGALAPGDSLSVIYGDVSGGSRGMRAGVIRTEPEPILVAVDREGDGSFVLHPQRPTIRTVSGPPARLLVFGPSSLVSGRSAELEISVVDRNFNPVDGFTGDLELKVIAGSATVPPPRDVRFERGWGTVGATPEAPGILRIEVSALGGILKSRANPMRVTGAEPQRKVYWGDLHSHSQYSHDGVGEHGFDYARHVAGLDFYSMTDHSIPPSDGYTHGLAEHVWEEYVGLAEAHNDPGEFVTLHGYEASFGSPYGHHNVFFRGEPGPLLAPARVTLPEMWAQLEAGQALTIPHHTGKMPTPVTWEAHHPDLRRNFEIYSAHGLSEAHDPEHPLSFENSDFTAPSRSAQGAQFAQDAWAAGLEMSTIASSDDHRAQPGKPHWGLVAVEATGLTRGEIFDALHERRTYGTTGARILLDFRVNGQPMGQRATAHGPPSLEIEAHGTDVIDVVEVLRHTPGEAGFRVIHRLRPDRLDFTWRGTDDGFDGEAIYYVRLRQRGQVEHRIAMAWSSPIWVHSAGAHSHGPTQPKRSDR